MFLSILRRAGYALGLLGLTLACKPGTDPVVTPEPPKPGVPTEVGKPLGTLVSKTIGPAGGTLSSADGSMTLRFPAGALTKETLITAQPVENTAFGGAGVGYEFGPHGTQFAKPVTMSWTYKPTDLRNPSPDALGIAYQDEKNVWQGHTNLMIDAANHQVSAQLRHFSRYSYYENLWLIPMVETLATSQTIDLKVSYQENLRAPTNNTGSDEDLLTPLAVPIYLDTRKGEVKNWRVNGLDVVDKPDSPVGMLSYGEGYVVRYKAPMKVPDSNPVAVSVEVQMKGRGKLMLVSNLTIESPNELFIGGSRQPEAYAAADITQGYLAVNMTGKPYDGNHQAGVVIQLIGINGPGSFGLTEENRGKLTVNGTDQALTNYFWTYTPLQGKPVYGPGNVTITEYDAKNQIVAGTFSATLHKYNPETKVYKSLAVKGRFRTGGG